MSDQLAGSTIRKKTAKVTVGKSTCGGYATMWSVKRRVASEPIASRTRTLNE
jgi:hypothetical protein